MMKTETQSPSTVLVVAAGTPLQVETLGQQQAAAALFALAKPRNGTAAPGRLSAKSLEEVEGAAPWPGLGDACPYCGSARYAVRRGKLANLKSEAGRCPICGTRGWSYRDD